MGPSPNPQDYDPATPLSWTPDGRQYDDETEDATGELDHKKVAATAASDAIRVWRALGLSEEEIIDLIGKIMAETLPERS